MAARRMSDAPRCGKPFVDSGHLALPSLLRTIQMSAWSTQALTEANAHPKLQLLLHHPFLLQQPHGSHVNADLWLLQLSRSGRMRGLHRVLLTSRIGGVLSLV